VRNRHFILILLAVLFGCTEDFPAINDGIPSRRDNVSTSVGSKDGLNGSWIVIAYEDLESGFKTLKNSENSWGGMDVTIKIKDNTFCGTNTSNSVGGWFTVTGQSFKLESYGGSKVGQPLWGNLFSDNIFIIESFMIKDNILRLYYNQNRNAIVLQRMHRDIGCNFIYQGI
jgi:hypothetical protein